MNANAAEWVKQNPDRRAKTARVARKKWAENNPEKDSEAKRKYTRENRKEIQRKNNLRYAQDQAHRLKILLRARLGVALRQNSSKKSAQTTELLGAPWVWVEAYLEEQFLPGMTWENHGPVWEIDHIRPCASFDLTIPEQQRMCFHWTNLQPLFTPDNRRKSDKYDPLAI